MAEGFQQLNTRVKYQNLKQGVGEIPAKFQEVYFFYICRTNKDEFLSGSQDTATKCVIGRNQIDKDLEDIIASLIQGQRVLARVGLEEDFIEYEVEVIRFGKIQNLPWQLEGDERYLRALELKQIANEAIKKQEYKEAFINYQSGLRLLNGDVGLQEQDLAKQLRSNLCLAALKQGDYDRCLKEATIILKDDNLNAKILHRRAIAYINLLDYDLAKNDLNLAIKLEPDNKELKKELDSIASKQKKDKDKNSAMYKKMLFGN